MADEPDKMPALKKLAAETAEALPEPAPPAPAAAAVDPHRIRLLAVIDSPLLRGSWDGTASIVEMAEALYTLSCGPDALEPLLAGDRAKFTVAALNFHEHHARNLAPEEVLSDLAGMIGQGLAAGEDLPTEAPAPAVSSDAEDQLILDKLEENKDAQAELRELHEKQKKGKK